MNSVRKTIVKNKRFQSDQRFWMHIFRRNAQEKHEFRNTGFGYIFSITMLLRDNCEIKENGAKILAESLCGNIALKQLSLGSIFLPIFAKLKIVSNLIADKGAEYFGEMLAVNKGLLNLNLSKKLYILNT